MKTSYTEGLDGRNLTTTLPNGSTVGYSYESAGQMVYVTDAVSNSTGFAWTANGQLTAQTSPNGGIQSRSYDPDGQTTAITHGASTHGYDAAGHLTTTSLTTPAGLGITSATGSTLTYNNAQELTPLTPANGAVTTYTYDARAARLSATTAASGPVPASTTQYSYTATAALNTATLRGGNVIGYTSDGNNLRQSRTAAGTTTAFTWSTAAKLPLLLDDGAHTYIYGPSSSPIAQIDDTTHAVEYLDNDLIGPPTHQQHHRYSRRSIHLRPAREQDRAHRNQHQQPRILRQIDRPQHRACLPAGPRPRPDHRAVRHRGPRGAITH